MRIGMSKEYERLLVTGFESLGEEVRWPRSLFRLVPGGRTGGFATE